MDNNRIFSFLADYLARGERCALVTVVAVTGTSMRDPGAHLAVSETGAFTGSLSGGCIEQAVVAEVIDMLQSGPDAQPGSAHITRYGAGSPYIDIRLPCGGGLDLHFQPLGQADSAFIDQCQRAITQRTAFAICLQTDGSAPHFSDGWRRTCYDQHRQMTYIGHIPAPRLLIIGHGAAVHSLFTLAHAIDLDIAIRTPDLRLINQLAARCDDIEMLRTPSDISGLTSDAWTAIVFLFHEHLWEIDLMVHLLAQPHFYIGAMGGKTANAARLEALALKGVSAQKQAEIMAPIGLFHSSRDPDTLALSTLSQIIQCYQNTDFSVDNG